MSSFHDIDSDAPALLSSAEVRRLFNVSASTIRRYVKDGRIPPPIKVGPKLNRWPRDECLEALKAMTDASKGGSA